MTVQFTEFQRPDPDTEYEELEPIIIIPGDPVIIIDKNDPPIKPRTVVCCTCQGGRITVCSTENSSGGYVTEYIGGMLAYTVG